MSALAGLGLPGGLPWWIYLVALLAYPAVYICRLIVVYKIGSKALDKVSQDRVPEVVHSVTGHRGPEAGEAKSPDRALPT